MSCAQILSCGNGLVKTSQIRGVEERKHEAYEYYDECLSDKNNKVDEVFLRV